VRLLFLDFDGVMNRITPAGYDPLHPRLAPELVARVARLVDQYSLGVVVSSSWRENYSLSKLDILLAQSGGERIARKLIGVTPIYERMPKRKYLRASEVADYLRDNAPGAAHVVLDDSAKHNFPADRFVHVNGKFGFQEADFERAVAVLAAQA
jgi:hypothetical protein